MDGLSDCILFNGALTLIDFIYKCVILLIDRGALNAGRLSTL